MGNVANVNGNASSAGVGAWDPADFLRSFEKLRRLADVFTKVGGGAASPRERWNATRLAILNPEIGELDDLFTPWTPPPPIAPHVIAPPAAARPAAVPPTPTPPAELTMWDRTADLSEGMDKLKKPAPTPWTDQAAAPATEDSGRRWNPCRRALIPQERGDDWHQRRDRRGPCGSWSCPDCHPWKRSTAKDRLAHHVRRFTRDNPGAPLYVGVVGDHAWEHGVADQITRRRGAFVRVYSDIRLPPPGSDAIDVWDRAVLATVPFAGGKPMEADAALGELTTAIDRIPIGLNEGVHGGRHPVVFCRAWPPLETADPQNQWVSRRRRLPADVADDRKEEIVLAHGVKDCGHYTTRRPDGPGHTVFWYNLPDDWTEADAEVLDHRIAVGLLPAEGERWDVGRPSRQKWQADDSDASSTATRTATTPGGDIERDLDLAGTSGAGKDP